MTAVQDTYLLWFAAVAAAVAALVSLWAAFAAARARADAERNADARADTRHRELLTALHEALARQSERLGTVQTEASERLRATVAGDLGQSREALHALERSQGETLAGTREALLAQLAAARSELVQRQDALRTDMLGSTLERLAEQSRAERELLQSALNAHSQQLAQAIEALTRRIDERLEQISGRVGERLEEGFKKTNETFVSVMARLATIDEAQKKIDGLTTNVVGLQELLGDKRARGAFGEVQLEALVANILPPSAYAMQFTLSNGSRVDCVLKLPQPTGMVAVDSKFPLENYRRMLDAPAGSPEVSAATRQFKIDVKSHVDAIASKYVIPPETSDGAAMFLPAEAVFAEIHAHHQDLVEYAYAHRVWIVSPTTLMAVLNTARAVMKDVETRRQVHIIKDELARLGKDFARFDERMGQLARHIGQVGSDVEEVHKSSQKITRRFAQIERVELDEPHQGALRLVEGADE